MNDSLVTVSALPITCPLPVKVRLTGYRSVSTVTGFRRARNAGPVVTIAESTWHREGLENEHPETDWVTMMRLADMLGTLGYHNLPRNPDRAYHVPRYAKTRGDTGEIVG